MTGVRGSHGKPYPWIPPDFLLSSPKLAEAFLGEGASNLSADDAQSLLEFIKTAGVERTKVSPNNRATDSASDVEGVSPTDIFSVVSTVTKTIEIPITGGDRVTSPGSTPGPKQRKKQRATNKASAFKR